MTRNKKIIIAALVGVAGGLAIYFGTERSQAPRVATQPITRGDIEETVGATGTLEAVTTVQVGTQVSGSIQELHADFNTPVRKGQVIARLDPSLFQTQLEQARASLDRSEADLERARLTEADALRKLDRARKLAEGGLIPKSDLDTTEAAYTTASAQVRSAEAQLTQARASLNQAQVSLDKTIITAPINGIVIARNVDVGQTVAASFQAPTLFVIAADLTKMRVNASIHEADIGRIRPGQAVRFRVDAYPADEFPGTVSLVRLSPAIQQNVVTYATVIDVPNPRLKLKPGMTATVTVRIAACQNVLRIPNTALRFHPTADIFAAFGQPAPPEKTLRATSSSAKRQTSKAKAGAELFGPLPAEDTPGQVWVMADGKLTQRTVILGITDGIHTELRKPDLAEGTELVTGVSLSGAGPATTTASPATRTTTNPLMGPQRPPPSRKEPQ